MMKQKHLLGLEHFPADDLAKIDEIVPPGSNVSPFYEADFCTPLYRW